MKRQSPQLPEKEWPELRRIKAANKNGWSYFGALGTFEEEAAKIINPKIKIYFTKLMTEGNPYCELVFEEIKR